MAVKPEMCAAITRRLMFVYAATLLFAGGLHYLEVRWLRHEALVGQFPFGFKMAGIMIAMWMLLIAYTAWRIVPVVRQWCNQPTEPRREKAIGRLLALPYEILIGVVLLTTVPSVILRVAQLVHTHDSWSNWAQGQWLDRFQQILGESGMGLTVGIVLYVMIRRSVRPFIIQMEPLRLRGAGRTTILRPLIVAYTGTFMVTIINLMQFVIASEHRGFGMDTSAFVASSLFYFTFGMTVLGFVALEFRRDLRVMIHSIRELVGGQWNHGGLKDKIPVISRDEAGELAMTFNELRERVSQEYEELEKELRLAYNIQQRLLPPGDIVAGSFRIFSWSRSEREVGGDLCDVVTLDKSRVAIAIGDVSGKGMPAALVMSAVIVLFRSEIKRGGSSNEVLQRINEQLCDTLGGESYVSLGIGLLDTEEGTLTYASAGHMSPYYMAIGAAPIQVEGSSLPIGFDPAGRYEEMKLHLSPGDRFIMYTDGMVELRNRQGELFGFERLEQELADWGPGVPSAQLVDGLLKRMDSYAGAQEQDDRTIVVLERQSADTVPAGSANLTLAEGGQMICQWQIPATHGSERQVLRELDALVAEAWPHTHRLEDMKSAIAEAIINAAEHGYGLDTSRLIPVQVQIGTHLIVCRIYDGGTGFNACEMKGKELYDTDRSDREDPRGWGLMLIDGLSDYWETGRDKEGFYVELFFLRKAERSREEGE
ncbi:ATP-binding SpoIIE family protein phosphatase [Paenibacillus daejeonensis]|uniref:ATP-binding SpoIIE family protein phosphatase n=1 Tax=Paenibacillus daejeonensis TaxID=135193 RepID=UPI000A068F5D|nr:SpoIIE family protein phosphatase [Paenibacillus daejeonensis]